MLPLLTFASGLVAGIVGLRVLKNVKPTAGIKAASAGLDRAEAGLRQATVSGLTAIERSSAALRERLTPAEVVAGTDDVVAEAEPTPPAEATPAARPRRRTRTAAKPETDDAPAPRGKKRAAKPPADPEPSA